MCTNAREKYNDWLSPLSLMFYWFLRFNREQPNSVGCSFQNQQVRRDSNNNKVISVDDTRGELAGDLREVWLLCTLFMSLAIYVCT